MTTRLTAILLMLLGYTALAQTEPPIPTMTVGDVTYEQVALTDYRDSVVTFSHAVGNKKVPITVLTREQLQALLVTNDRVRIDPGKFDLTPPSAEAVKQAEKLIQAAGDVNGLLPNGNTPLIEAAVNGWEDVARALIARDADMNLRNGSDQLPLRAAAERGQGDVCRLLRDSGVKVTDLKIAMLMEDAALVYEIAAKNKNLLKSIDGEGMTPMMRAAANNQGAVLQSLVKAGASFKEQDPVTGATPLMIAASRGQAGAMEALIAGGAPIDAKDSSGWTPIMHAAAAGQTNAVVYLLSKNAKVSIPGGPDAVALAREKGQTGVVQVLEQAQKAAQEAALAAAARASNAATAKSQKMPAAKKAAAAPAAAPSKPQASSAPGVPTIDFSGGAKKEKEVPGWVYTLLFVGLIMYLVGNLWMIVSAWQESIGWAIAMFLLNPLPNVIYFFMHIRETWIPFTLLCLGTILSMGALVLAGFA